MRGQLVSFVLKAALFLLIANFVMIFIVPPFTAEWYITLFSVILMLVLIAGIQIAYAIKRRREKQ